MSSIEGTTISNSTIELTEDASASTLRNLNFYANCTSENPDYFTPININEARDLIIENNYIYIDYYDGCNYNLAGIYATGASYNIIRNNRITIFSNDINESEKKYYMYGIDFSSYNSESSVISQNNIITGNTIDLYSNYYLSAVTLSCSRNDIVSDNTIYLKSLQFAYGITCEYFYTPNIKESSNITIMNNDISAVSNMVYLIELFTVNNYTVSGNILYSVSNASYAISAYEAYDLNIQDNDIKVIGNDTSLIGFNVDAVSTGHNGIYILKESHDINITNNKILSLYELGEDYAIRFSGDSNSNILVFNNNLSSNHYAYSADDAVFGNVSIFNNKPYSDDISEFNTTNIIIKDIYVNLRGSDEIGDGSFENPFASINQALIYLKDLNSNLDVTDTTVIKGIVHIAPGTYSTYGRNVRLYITDLMVDLVGDEYNQTILAGDLKNWFFEISKGSTVSLKNLTFENGIFRNKDGGLIYNKGTLTLNDCVFINSKLTDSSAIIYNDGILKLKNNILEITSEKGFAIYNNGFIDNLILSFIADSSNDEDRIMYIDSSKANLTAFVHDDMGNPVSGGFIKFYIQSKEIVPVFDLYNGKVLNESIISLMGTLKVSGYYSGSYTNTFINLGKIISSVNIVDVAFYVSEDGSDSTGDGSAENPFGTIDKALSYLGSIVDHCSIYLSDGKFNSPKSSFKAPYGVSIIGSKQTFISGNWHVNYSNTNIELRNLIFNGSCIDSTSTNLTINNCSFYNAPISAIRSLDTNLTVIKSNFIDNGLADHSTTFTLFPFDMNDFNLGGAIYNIKGNLTIIDSNFINNEAVFGGAIFNNQSDLHISSSNFTGNLASAGLCITPSFGGAIYQYLGKEIIVSDCLFFNNSASAWGGAFYSSGTQPNMIESGASQHPEYDVEYSYQEIYFINTIFDSNVAPKGGGALYIINNSFTEYISCIFRNNAVYTYDVPFLMGYGAGVNWIYESDINHERDTISSSQLNLGGAFYDKNVHIVDSSFESNTYDSGGALILPTVIHNSVELEYNTDGIGIQVADLGSGGGTIYVSDSSLLSADDSQYLGISGWEGTRTDGSITHSGSNAGDNGIPRSNGSSGGSGEGLSPYGSGGSGTLTWGDIISYLGSIGSDLTSSDGFGISSGNGANSNSSNNHNNTNSRTNGTSQSSENSIEVSATQDIIFEDAGGSGNNGASASSVGTSGNPLGGESSDNGADSSKSSQSSDASSSVGESAAKSLSKAYEIYKNDTISNVLEKDMDIYRFLLIVIFSLLILLGYYRKSRDDEDI